MRSGCITLTAIAVVSWTIAAQTTPPRSPAASASIAGRLVTADASARPIGGAVVALRGPAFTADTVTDDDGRFTFAPLPAGRFTIGAAKAAFLPGALGADRPGRPGIPVSLATDQHLNGVVVRLTHGGAIGGTVRDALGHPAFGVNVTALKPNGTNAAASVSADDRGMYRIFGLAPGEYLVAASPRPSPISGEITQRSTTDVDAIFAALELRAGRPGGLPAAGPGTGTSQYDDQGAVHAGAAATFAPVFHPGTPVFGQASRIALAAGESREDADIALTLTPVASVSGVVTNPAGPLPAGLQLTARSNGPALSLGSMMPSAAPAPAGPSMNSEGAFRLTGLAPGDYTMTARAAGSRPGGLLWASTDVTIGGTDIEGVALTLRPGLTFSGRVAFDAAANAPRDVSALQVRLVSATAESAGPAAPQRATAAPATPSLPPGTVRADGTFEVAGLVPGAYHVVCVPPAGATPPWWLRAVFVNGRDALDAPVDLSADVRDAVVQFSDRHSELSGTLQTSGGQPAPEFFIVVLPADRALWRPGARRIQSTRPATDGHFAFRDLPGGDYLMAALTDVAPGDLDDAAFLASMAGAAVRVTVTDGARVTQDLRISGGSSWAGPLRSGAASSSSLSAPPAPAARLASRRRARRRASPRQSRPSCTPAVPTRRSPARTPRDAGASTRAADPV